MWLHVVTCGYKWLQVATSGYSGFMWITVVLCFKSCFICGQEWLNVVAIGVRGLILPFG